MPQSLNRDKLIKDYYKCIQLQTLKKNNGSPYLKIRLLNDCGIIDGYLWDMIDFYAKKINQNSIYAIKAKKEIYNNEKVLHIKNINLVLKNNYDRYGYSSKKISLSNKKLSEYYYDKLMDSISSYSNPAIKLIVDFYKEMKDDIIKSHLLCYKQICIKHLFMLNENSQFKIDQDLCIILILIDRLEIDLLMREMKKNNIKYYNMIKLYRKNDKEFIKKYKYIVDLIRYNFDNEKSLKLI